MEFSLAIINTLALIAWVWYLLGKTDWGYLSAGIISVAVTISLLSCIFYLSLAIYMPFYFLLGGLTSLNILCGGLIIKKRGWRLARKSKPVSKNLWISSTFFLLYALVFSLITKSWGQWDGWAIWNMHAKFLFFPDYWENMFSNTTAIAHPDYPLMLPAFIAFSWQALGYITPVVPSVLSFIFYIGIPFFIASLFWYQGKPVVSFIALSLFIIDFRFAEIACSQYADTLLAFFILLSLVIYKQCNRKNVLAVLLGFIAASAVWIKNEGILFYAVFTFCLAIATIKHHNYRFFSLYLAGSLLPIAILMSFKAYFSPANDLVGSSRIGQVLPLLLSPERYITIMAYMAKAIVKYNFIGLGLFILFLFFKPANILRAFSFWVLFLILTGYFLIYTITPHELAWHLSTSVSRLFHHLYPAAVYGLLLHLSKVMPKLPPSLKLGTYQINIPGH